jgi:hypothetical protein
MSVCIIVCVRDSKSMSDTWIECKDTRHGVGGGAGGDVSLKCDFSFKIGKDVSRRERMQHLNRLFSAMVEQVDGAFGDVWVGRSRRLEENEEISCSGRM